MSSLLASGEASWQLASDEAVSGADGHNAFTTLTMARGAWLCAYREASGHVSHDGRIRVARRDPEGHWETTALLESPDPTLADLRDPKLCRSGDQIFLIATATRREPTAGAQAYLWTMGADPTTWSPPAPMLPYGLWAWGIAPLPSQTTNDVVVSAYPQRGMGGETNGVALWYGIEGRFGRAEPLIDGVQEPNETAVASAGDQLACLVRMRYTRDGQPQGVATLLRRGDSGDPWRRSQSPGFIGGPNLIFLPDGRLLAAGRRLEPETQTVIWEIVGDEWVERLVLPASGPDSSYPSMAVTPNGLAVTYYTQTESGCQVRFAQVTIA